MPVSDLNIARSAHLFIQLHEDEATAREMVTRMRRSGDNDRAVICLCIIVASIQSESRRPRNPLCRAMLR